MRENIKEIHDAHVLDMKVRRRQERSKRKEAEAAKDSELKSKTSQIKSGDKENMEPADCESKAPTKTKTQVKPPLRYAFKRKVDMHDE